MALFLIGLGLGDEKDITVRGLERIKQSDVVYLEHYTSILGVDMKELQDLYGKEVLVADRNLVESHAEERLLKLAKNQDVALLVVGDPFSATTHTDLLLRARAMNVKVEVVHNASIMNAIGVVGLELYKYGKTTSIPFWDGNFQPETPYDVIKENQARGCHTLCLLDIKVHEPTKEALLHGADAAPEKMTPRFMTIKEALDLLLRIERKRKERVITPDTLVIGAARIGQPSQTIIAGKVKDLLAADFGGPLHSLIIPAKLQVIEEEALRLWR